MRKERLRNGLDFTHPAPLYDYAGCPEEPHLTAVYLRLCPDGPAWEVIPPGGPRVYPCPGVRVPIEIRSTALKNLLEVLAEIINANDEDPEGAIPAIQEAVGEYLDEKYHVGFVDLGQALDGEECEGAPEEWARKAYEELVRYGWVVVGGFEALITEARNRCNERT